jgi:cytochrome c553
MLPPRPFRFLTLLLLVPLAATTLTAGDAAQAKPKDQASTRAKAEDTDPWSFDRRIEPLLSRYCYPCHNGEKTKGDVNLRRDENPKLIADHRKTWMTALKEVREGEMPPEKAKQQPTAAERALIGDFIDRTLNTLDCSETVDPGRPAARRLNRVEYDNTIRALFGLDLSPGQQFSPDGSSYGFDTIADALTISPVQVEQYYDAAGKVLDAALKDRKASAAVFIRQPGPGGQPRAAAREIIAAFATRAYRKPVDPAHLERLLAVYDVAAAAGKPFTLSVRAALQAVLISPRFLMRIEDGDPKATGPYPVSPYDLASRLSYFLWSAPPDDELLALAAQGRLADAAVLEQQALRMLKDGRSRALAENFAGQWLQLRGLPEHQIDAKVFPRATASLRTAMLEEAVLFITELFRGDRPVTDLLDANYTFLNEELAGHYGIDGVKGAQMRRVALTDHRRGGVVTMAAVLTITADPGRTNIPRRGNYVMGTILGLPPPPPPANVPQLDEAPGGAPKTVREMLELHRTKPECAACHAKTDPLGFGLENYDATGHWQDTQAGKPVDASGVLPGGERFDGPVEMKRILLGRKREFARSLSEAMLIYALGRGLQHADECTMRDLLKALESADYRASALVTAIVRSYPFTHRRNPDY